MFDADLYRSIWIDDSKNRQLIFDDLINAVKCPHCKVTTKLDFPFLCVDIKKEFALWFEPFHDPEIDKDIAQYTTHMGKNSFYAKAQRISNWQEFKEKIFELEGFDKNDSSLKLSNDLKKSFDMYLGDIKEKNKESKYPKYIRHLRTVKGRLLYSPLPFLLLLLFIFIDKGYSGLLRDIEHSYFVSAVIIFCFSTFVGLSLLNMMVIKIIPNWKARKDIRLWCFCSFFWIAGVFLFVAVLDPYNNGSWSSMRNDEWMHMYLIMLVPPAFAGSAKYVYEKFIK
jgi:hypothetical protein